MTTFKTTLKDTVQRFNNKLNNNKYVQRISANKHFKKSKSLLFSKVGFIIIFGLVGTVALALSFADTTATSFEAEAGTPNNVTVGDDSTASGGKYVKFGTSGATADGVFNADGTINATGYKAMAAKMASADGITYRFGTAATTAKSTNNVPAATIHKYTAPRGYALNYEYGTPNNLPGPDGDGDYSSNQGQVGYIATGTPTAGVDDVQTLYVAQNVVTMEPVLPWTLYGAGHPDYSLTNAFGTAGQNQTCASNKGTSIGKLVAQARSYSHGEDNANSIMAFDNGFITSAGSNNTKPRVDACVKLPDGMIPTSISVTDFNEFALVTVWNTNTLKSQLVVIAMAGKFDPNAAPQDQADKRFYWPETYPGFQNYGHPSFMKYLGAVDLDDGSGQGIRAATSVSAVSDNAGQYNGQRICNQNSDQERATFPLSTESNRQTYITGCNTNQRAYSGYAVVTSRPEKKAEFVDLQPLFDQITQQYFGTRAQFDAAFNNVGLGDTQFPKTFANNAASMPKVIKTVPFDQPVSAAVGMLSGAATPRAYVATADGKLHVFNVGGLADKTAASAAAITEAGTINVGLNVTNITHPKDVSYANDNFTETQENTLILTARGSRKVQWLTLSGNTGTIKRELQDSRLIDPIAAEIGNTHATESYMVDVADYGAGRLFGYRYGPIILHSGNPEVTFPLSVPFEYTGQYDPKGNPFSITVNNVT